jgi:hypothetical protein
VDKAEKVLDVVFPSGDKSSEVLHPGKEPLDLPSSAITARLASILSSEFAATPIGRDQLDTVFALELAIERVRVVGLVADEPGRELVEKASGKNLFHKLALGRRSALDRYGERKTVTSGDSDDLRPLAATGRADGEAPFFALAKVAFTNASSRFSLPYLYSYVASSRSASARKTKLIFSALCRNDCAVLIPSIHCVYRRVAGFLWSRVAASGPKP